MTEAAFTELRPLVSIKWACALVGKPRGTCYRRLHTRPAGERRRRSAPANTLHPAERRQVADILHEPRFCDLAPAQIWARLLDEGVYLASISTMYRVLREQGESRDRRRQRTHPARKKPELLARKPNEVWSWDITKLRGPERSVYYEPYVIIDIFSRYVPGWLVAPAESAELAEALIASAIATNGQAPGTIHADRGSSMTSKWRNCSGTWGWPAATPAPTSLTTTPTQKPASRPSSTSPPSRTVSAASRTPGPSAAGPSTTTTTNTATPPSASTPPPRSTLAPLPRSAPSGPWSLTPPTTPTPNDSPNHLPHPGCRPQPGSTDPTRRCSYRPNDDELTQTP